jgi:hypothetical protein
MVEITSLRDAIAGLVRDGDTVALEALHPGVTREELALLRKLNA